MKKNTRKAQLFDFVGNPINVGDFIAYGKSLGRCAGVNIGVVRETYEVEVDHFYSGSLKWDARISVIANQDDWKEFTKRDPNAIEYGKSTMKKTTLSFPARCVVINDIGQSPLADEFRRLSQQFKDEIR
jgi:hypothetical protein